MPFTAVPILTHLLAKKEMTLHEVQISATEPFMAGVDTVSKNHFSDK